MLAALLMAVSGGLFEIFLKRSVNLSRLTDRMFVAAGQVAGIAMVLALAALSPVSFGILADGPYSLAALAIILVWFSSSALRLKAFKEEKVSVLLPWSNLLPLLSVVAGYFLDPKVSVPAFAVALASVLGLAAYGFLDARGGKFSAGVFWFVLSVLCDVAEAFVSAWIVAKHPVASFTLMALLAYFGLTLALTLNRRHWKGLRSQPDGFWTARTVSSVLMYGCWFLGLFLYRDSASSSRTCSRSCRWA